MKTSLRKLRGFALHKNDPKEKRDNNPSAQQDELLEASQDMQDMRDCYDSLLSAAAATANSAYEFSEALQEMGTCLLEKTSLIDDEESGRVLLMLGKAQFELQKLVNSYRAHIIQTITSPSESLLKELQTVEEMKRQCDDKRDMYAFMLSAQREKGRSKNAKGESFSAQQLQAAHEDYDEEATLFVFRLKSLKQGQSRSLLTQAARHHAAQLSFFRKGLKSLEVVEPHVKLVAEQHHIDYQFSGLEDDDSEDIVDDDDDNYGYDDNDDGELSFDYGQNDQGQDFSTSRNSMELDQVDHTPPPTLTTETAQENLDRSQELLYFSRGPRVGSQSAPIFADKKFDPAEKIKEMRPSSTRKFHTYVLPTPVDAKRSTLTGSGNPVSAVRVENKGGLPKQSWHSSPLEPNKHVKDSRNDELSSAARLLKAQSVLKESNINSGPIRMPPPLAEGLSLPQLNLHTASDNKKIKRQAFSGPLTSKAWSTKPMFSTTDSIPSVEFPRVISAIPGHPTQPSLSPKVSPSASPPLMPSPKISELHELPRPPITYAKPTRPSSLVGHSAPLVSRSQELSVTSRMLSIASHTASPLPTPPGPMIRSFSIPSNSQRTTMLTVSKLLEAPRNPDITEDFASPPLTPIYLANVRPASPASETVTQATKTKGSS